MSSEEMSLIGDWLSNLKMETLDMQDQLLVMGALTVFYEKLKPIAVKDMAKDTSSTFLFKL